MMSLNLDLERWDMLASEHVESALDFNNFDISAIADYISPSNIDSDHLPWSYNQIALVKPGGMQ